MSTTKPRSSAPKFWAYILNPEWVEIRQSSTQPRFNISTASMINKQGNSYRLKVHSLVGGIRVKSMGRWQFYRHLTRLADSGLLNVGSVRALSTAEVKRLGLKP